MAFVDFTLDKGDRTYHDLDIVDGDFKTTDGYSTSLLMTVMCERRASESEVPKPSKRRGWFGNEFAGFDNFEIGSKLWLLSQARADELSLNNAVTYVEEASQWYVDDNLLDKVEVTGTYIDLITLELDVKFFKSQDLVFQKGFTLWENTLSELEN
jgi:phage gp46-like protein